MPFHLMVKSNGRGPEVPHFLTRCHTTPTEKEKKIIVFSVKVYFELRYQVHPTQCCWGHCSCRFYIVAGCFKVMVFLVLFYILICLFGCNSQARSKYESINDYGYYVVCIAVTPMIAASNAPNAAMHHSNELQRLQKFLSNVHHWYWSLLRAFMLMVFHVCRTLG